MLAHVGEVRGCSARPRNSDVVGIRFDRRRIIRFCGSRRVQARYRQCSPRSQTSGRPSSLFGSPRGDPRARGTRAHSGPGSVPAAGLSVRPDWALFVPQGRWNGVSACRPLPLSGSAPVRGTRFRWLSTDTTGERATRRGRGTADPRAPGPHLCQSWLLPCTPGSSARARKRRDHADHHHGGPRVIRARAEGTSVADPLPARSAGHPRARKRRRDRRVVHASSRVIRARAEATAAWSRAQGHWPGSFVCARRRPDNHRAT